MSLIVAILAHQNFNRVASVAKFLSDANIHVAIHIDATIDGTQFNEIRTSLSNYPDILWTKRIACDWGDFSLVEASLNMSEMALDHWPDAKHVLLISGDSLPIRPLTELREYLDNHADTDFIESVLVNGNNWVTDGLGIERFTLHFPFSWKTQRKVFDIWVDIQRKLKIRRKIPNGMRLHIGSQWWCLTRKTLTAILRDPQRTSNDNYFAKCWIPDESYFSTLARKHSERIESRSLVFSKFDYQGKPIIFYDDHVDALMRLEEFFTRKVWYGASKLYTTFIDLPSAIHLSGRTETDQFDKIGANSDDSLLKRSDTHIQNRAAGNSPKSAAPYQVFTGVQHIFPEFNSWLSSQKKIITLGRVFAKDRVLFDSDGGDGPGGLSNEASIRDHAPESFLYNLVWNTKSEGLGFHHEVYDLQNITEFFLRDPNANLYYIRHSWVIELMNRRITNHDYLQIEAAKMAQQERAFISKIRALDSVCEVNVWTVGEIITDPTLLLSKVSSNLGIHRGSPAFVVPKMADLSNLVSFGHKLRNSGVAMDVKALEASSVKRHGSSRVQVIK